MSQLKHVCVCACSFPKQVQRPKEGKGRLPGPGEYRVSGDLEPQALSTRLTSPRVSFPIAPKDQSEKVQPILHWRKGGKKKTYAFWHE